MKNIFRATYVSVVTLTLFSLAACGGGGGGTPATGTPGAAVSQGVITAKGSVFVNGVEFSTSGATVKIDDAAATENDLKVGMVVKVRGSSDDATRKGTALQIEARDALEGQIQAVDNINKTITVMGQTIRVEDNVTRLNDDDNVKLLANAGFQPGDFVEVHGLADDQGLINATRVAKKAQGEFEMKGFVTGLGATSFGLSMTPNGTSVLTVNFAANLLPAGTANGSLVEVKATAAPSAGAVTASLIKAEDKLAEAGEKVKVEGIVAGGTVDDFTINGREVVTTAATIFEGGLRSDFTVGDRVEAEGPLDASGIIHATKIEFKSNIRIEADVTAFTAGSSITLLGKQIAINSLTRSNGTPVVGDHVEVRAKLDRDGNLIATRIKLNSGNATRAFLQGPVTSASAAAGTLTILGITANTDASTQFRVSSDSTEQAVSAATFFAAITPNVTVVKVRWDSFTSVALPIKEAEIEEGK